MSALTLILALALGAALAWVIGRLRPRERMLHATLMSVADAVAVADTEERIWLLSPMAETLTGWTSKEAAGRNLREVLRLVPEEGGESGGFDIFDERRAAGQRTRARLTPRSGTEKLVEIYPSVVRDHGRPKGVIVLLRDVTETSDLEERLRHSQSMEALGRLAKGIAHDFNNLLTVISGHASLLSEKIPFSDNPLLHDSIEAILEAAERGAQLTGQLSAFSNWQEPQPVILNLNDVLTNMDRTLRTLAGAHSAMVTVLDPELGHVKVDPGQIRQVIMDLVMYAHDALPCGMKLSVRTKNVEPDNRRSADLEDVKCPYVLLEVSNTAFGTNGSQQAKNAQSESIVPAPGNGSQVAATFSVVQRILKQADGRLEISSRPGRSISIRVYLPRRVESGADPRPSLPRAAIHTGAATILVAEREPAVRNLICSVLEAKGHIVLEARDDAEALRMMTENLNRVDLVVADVTLRSLGTRELAERLSILRPDLKVLYISGFGDVPSLADSQNRAFLAAPFTAATLLAGVEKILSGVPPQNRR